MIEFTIKLADKVIFINSNFETTKKYCKDYLFNGKPDFFVSIDEKDIDFEIKLNKSSPMVAELMALYRKICFHMADYETFMFHGSAWLYNENGYIFTAPSGTGKSTHGEKWQRLFGAEAINDDKPLLSLREKPTVWGTPWMGKHKRGKNISCPIKAICLIEQSETNRIERLSPKDGLDVILKQSHIPSDANSTAKILSLAIELSKSVSVYKLFCNIDDDAAFVSFGEMTANR